MIDSFFRSAYQKKIIDPLLEKRALRLLSPNMITLAAFLCGLSIPFFLYYRQMYPALALLLLSGFFDTLDGSLARLRQGATNKGALFDLFSDRCVEFSIILGLYLYDPLSRGLLCILMLGSVLLCITSFLTVGIFQQSQSEKSFYYSPGIIERAEAFFFFFLMILFPTLFFALAAAFSSLVLLTALIRMKEFSRK